MSHDEPTINSSARVASGAAANSFALDEMLDLNAAGPLRTALLVRRGADLAVDASAVQHLGAQCAQVLASAALTWAADGVRGEVTVVVEGVGADVVDVPTDAGSLAALVSEEELVGATRKEAIAEVARRAGLPKRVVYDAVVAFIRDDVDPITEEFYRLGQNRAERS